MTADDFDRLDVDRPDFDRIEVEALRRAGSVKWAAYPDAIGAFIAEMDFGTAPAVRRALHRAVDAAQFGYLPKALSEAMSQACATWCRDRYGWDVDPDDVRPVADVLEALKISIEFFTPPGASVILPTPAYMPFVTLPAVLGREVLQVPMVEDGGRARYDLDALDAAFRGGGHLLVVCNPHNPIGRVLEPDEMLAVSEVVHRHGGRVFSDEIHAPLVYPEYRHVPYASVSPTAAGHTLTATSASKAWNLPGVKCAQVILSNSEDRKVWSRHGYLHEHGASILGVVANTAAYAEGGPWLDEVLSYLDGNRKALGDLVAELLPGVRYTAPEGTYLAWLDFRDTPLAGKPAAQLLEHAQVALTEGALCGDAGRGFARLNFATPRPVLVRAVEQLGTALRAAPRG
jgi:cysteine-S-conjugate beta-lyase